MVDEKTIQTIVSKYFMPLEGDFYKTACNALSRIEREDWEADRSSAVIEALTGATIYTEDRWAVMKHYCTPDTADMALADEKFFVDLMTLANKMFAED